MNRALMIVTTTAVFLVLAIYLALNVQTFVGRMVLAACVGTALLLKPEIALFGAIVSGPMELHLPGFVGIFRLQHFFLFALLAYGVLDAALRKSQGSKYASALYLWGFAAVLVVVIAFRGIGFRVFGSEAFGGADYVKIFLTIGGYWGGLKVAMTPRRMKWMIAFYALGSLVPFVAQYVLSYRPSLFFALQRFIETRAQYVLSEEELYGMRGVGGGIGGRIHAAGALASGLWIILWGLWGFARGGKRSLLYLAVPLLAALGMLSGFRGNTAGIVFLAGLCLYATSSSKVPTLVGGLVVGALSYAALFVIGPQLPLNAQRALSVIPGIPWDATAVKDATHTITWRVEVWQYAIKQLPQYLVVGRGLLLEDVYRQHAWRDWSYYSSPEFFYATHAYHSGPLSLLLDTGLAGFIAFLGFQISVVREAWKGWSVVRGISDNFLRAVYFYFAVRVSFMLFAYYFLYGDIKYNIADWVVIGLLTQKIYGAVAKERAPTLDYAVAPEAALGSVAPRLVRG